MEFEKITAPTIKDLFVQQLENMILSGRLEIGSKLPPERELAKKMQVSRSVVNAGINEIAGKGFLEIRPRIGTFVADYRRNGTMETLLSIMKYNGGHLRRDELRSILEMKLVLDKLAARLAIGRIGPGELELLKGHISALEKAQSAEDAGKAAFEFYHELALISGNMILPLIYCSFKEPVLSLWARYGRKHGKETVYSGAFKLYEAVEENNLEKALHSIEQTVGDAISGSKEIYNE